MGPGSDETERMVLIETGSGVLTTTSLLHHSMVLCEVFATDINRTSLTDRSTSVKTETTLVLMFLSIFLGY